MEISLQVSFKVGIELPWKWRMGTGVENERQGGVRVSASRPRFRFKMKCERMWRRGVVQIALQSPVLEYVIAPRE